MKRAKSATMFAGAALIGLAGGWLLSRRYDQSHRRNLYSTRAHRRFAALGWLASEDDVVSLPVLHDYIAWEPLPALRQRARRIVRDLERST
jgi:hypothetical protein